MKPLLPITHPPNLEMSLRIQSRVVYVCGSTPVKIFFRLRLQNLSPCVNPLTGARVEAMESMAGIKSKILL
jgi:hypothetical protein